MFDRIGIAYPRTPKNKLPSITKEFLDGLDHPIAGVVRELRKLHHMRGTFVQGYLGKHAVNGRIHTEFNQLRGDEYGTVSGRFSSSNPNLQNIPARDEILAPLIRGLFLPEEGETWYCDDWSQIEFRGLVHYAVGRGADEARENYRRDPRTDYHEMTQAMIREKTGRDLGRKPTKNVNFGLVYGMGKPKLTHDLGLDKEQGEELFASYFAALPFVQDTFSLASKKAASRGYIRTLMGRKRRWDAWEPMDWNLSRELKSKRNRDDMNREVLEAIREARAKGERVPRSGTRRAFTHKALNALLQGGAADIMKLAMVEIWESGVCDVLGAPLLTVHDELDWSVDESNPEHVAAHAEAVRIMREAPARYLRVPLEVDVEKGPDWGHVG
jgi:DNA polymerase I-like protein with 3'-5' exonuclease and polymerase domains